MNAGRSNPVLRWLCWLLLLWAASSVAQAQTRAWLDRDRIAMGESTTLNIETTEPAVGIIDVAPLQRDFEVTGQSSRRSYETVGGVSRQRTLLAYALTPRQPGNLQVPALRVGAATTEPLPLQVSGGSAPAPQGSGEVFIESQTDTASPWVQQAVGHVVRLYSTVPILSGSLEMDTPEGAALRRVGDDAQYTREVGGRRYAVVERRYLLLPERSGALRIPGARFSGQATGNHFDRWFGDGRRTLSATGAARTLQVRPAPDNAPSPWLPLRSATLRWLQAPEAVAAGEVAQASVELVVDGAQASQLPDLELQVPDGVQVFAEAPQVGESFVDGRPRLRVVRSFSLLAEHAGAQRIDGPRLGWWDVSAGLAREASLRALDWQVTPGAGMTGDGAQDNATIATGNGLAAAGEAFGRLPLWWLLLPLLGVLGWLLLRRAAPASPGARRPPPLPSRGPTMTPATLPATRMPVPTLKQALADGDLPAIEQALVAQAGGRADSLESLAPQLADARQRQALAQLQAARWQGQDTGTALAALRSAFANGVALRKPRGRAAELLPPLYPR